MVTSIIMLFSQEALSKEIFYGKSTLDSPAAIGIIDIVLALDINATTVQKTTSYIVLEKTLLFPAVPPKIDGKDVGPRISGTLSPTSFSLTSDTFTSTIGGKTVSRRIALSNATVSNGGANITGTYTETVTGLTPQPLIISGKFVLTKPVPIISETVLDQNSDGCLNTTEIRAGGADSNKMEFSDVSFALNLYRTPTSTLRIGTPPGPNCTNADSTIQTILNEFYATQQ